MWVLYNTYIVYKGSEVGVRNVDTWSISYTISTDLPGADHLDHSLSRDRYEIESDERQPRVWIVIPLEKMNRLPE